jgi:hypothetical protein
MTRRLAQKGVGRPINTTIDSSREEPPRAADTDSGRVELHDAAHIRGVPRLGRGQPGGSRRMTRRLVCAGVSECLGRGER